jgi:hypothetical protein
MSTGGTHMDHDIPFTSLGILLILIGIAFVLIPIVAKLVPEVDLEKIPWFLLYIYRSDNCVFATSPLLIIVSIAYFLWTYLHR